MSNDIGITWTSDQKQLIADVQKRQLLQDQEIARLQKLAGVGKQAGAALAGGYKEVNAQLDRLGRLADTTFKKPISAMDAHLSRMKELRVLYRMGKIDIEQFGQAASASLKKRYADSGMTQQLANQKRLIDSERVLAAQSLAEQKAAANELALQKATALHEASVKERADAAQSLAEQKAAAKSLHLQKLTAIADERQRQKAAADQVRRSLLSERELSRATFRERMRELWDLRNANALSQQEYLAAAKKAQNTLQETSRIDMSQVWKMVPGQLTTILTLTGSIAAATKLARAEFENLKAVQNEAKGATLTYAEAASQAIPNLGNEMTGEDFHKWTLETSKKTGQSRTFLARAASGVLSAKGARTSQQALADLEQMVPFERFNPEELKESAAGVMQQLNIEADGTTLKQVMGQQIAAKIASRVESAAEFAGHVTKTTVGASAFGDSSRDAYAISAYLANASGDKSGQTSASGTIDLQADLQILSNAVESGALGMAPIKGGLGRSTLERARAIAQDPRFKGLQQRLTGENEDPEVQELFRKAGRMTARASNYGSIRQLYLNNATAWRNMNDVYGAIPELGPAAEKFVDKQLKDFDSPEHRTAIADQKLKSETENMQLLNRQAVRGAISRERLQELLKAGGVSNVEQVLQGLKFEVTSNGGQQLPASTAQEILRKYADDAAAPKSTSSSSGGWWGPEAMLKWLLESKEYREGHQRPATAAEMHIAESFRRSAEAIESLVQEERAMRGMQVNVVVPGANGEKPGVPAAAGLAR